MINPYSVVAALLIGLVIILCVAELYQIQNKRINKHGARIAELQKDINKSVDEVQKLTARIRNLELANSKRMPQRSQDEVLDAIAMQNARIERLKTELEYEENLQAHQINALSVGTKREKE